MRTNPMLIVILSLALACTLLATLLGAGYQTLVVGLALAMLVAMLVDARVAWMMFFVVINLNGVHTTFHGATVLPELLAVPILLVALTKTNRSIGGVIPAHPKTIGLYGAVAILGVTSLISSMLFAPDPQKSIWISIRLLNALACFILIWRMNFDRQQIIRIGTGVLTAVSLIGLTAWFIEPAGAGMLGFALSTDGRIRALSFEPNIFAGQAVAWLAVMYAWRNYLPKRHIASAAVLVLAIAFSGTRSAWIALAMLAGIIAIRAYGRPAKLVASIAAVSAAVGYGVLYLIPESSRQGISPESSPTLWRISHLFDTTAGSGAYRVDIYRIARADMETSGNWLLGSGMNSFSQIHPVDPTHVAAAYLSSIWYELVYDVGLVGLIAFLAFAVTYVSVCGRRLDALPILLTLLVCSSTTNTMWLAFFWVYLSLAPKTPSRFDHLEDRSQNGSANRLEVGRPGQFATVG